MSQANNYDGSGNSYDENKVYVKVGHNNMYKYISQPVSDIDIDQLRYKILQQFNYLENEPVSRSSMEKAINLFQINLVVAAKSK